LERGERWISKLKRVKNKHLVNANKLKIKGIKRGLGIN
jgi:hypothetical protein